MRFCAFTFIFCSFFDSASLDSAAPKSLYRSLAIRLDITFFIIAVVCNIYTLFLTRMRRTRGYWAYDGGNHIRTYVQKLSTVNLVGQTLMFALFLSLYFISQPSSKDFPAIGFPFSPEQCFRIGAEALVLTLILVGVACCAVARYISFMYGTTEKISFELTNTKQPNKPKRKSTAPVAAAAAAAAATSFKIQITPQAGPSLPSKYSSGLKFDSPAVQNVVLPYIIIAAAYSLAVFLVYLGYLSSTVTKFIYSRQVCFTKSYFTNPLSPTALCCLLAFVMVQCVAYMTVEFLFSKYSQNGSSGTQQIVKQVSSMEDSAFEYGEAVRTPFLQTTLTFSWGILLLVLLFLFYFREFSVIEYLLVCRVWFVIDSVFILILGVLFGAFSSALKK